MLDDLWLPAPAHLPELGRWEAAINAESSLMGRNLEPWRALLAVAGWVDSEGVGGLWQRMMDLSVAYQQERPNVEAADLTALVIRALGLILGKMVRDESTNSTGRTDSTGLSKKYFLQTSLITSAAQKIVEAFEFDLTVDQVTTPKVGIALNKMRLISKRQGNGGRRGWMISLDELIRWATSYGLDASDISGIDLSPHSRPGTVGTSGTVGTKSSGVFEGIL